MCDVVISIPTFRHVQLEDCLLVFGPASRGWEGIDNPDHTRFARPVDSTGQVCLPKGELGRVLVGLRLVSGRVLGLGGKFGLDLPLDGADGRLQLRALLTLCRGVRLQRADLGRDLGLFVGLAREQGGMGRERGLDGGNLGRGGFLLLYASRLALLYAFDRENTNRSVH